MASAAAGGAVGAFVVSAAAREEAVRRGEARSALCHACRRAIDADQEAFWCACRLRAERPPEEDGGVWIWFCRGCHCGEAQACAVCEAQDADGGGGAALEALVRRSALAAALTLLAAGCLSWLHLRVCEIDVVKAEGKEGSGHLAAKVPADEGAGPGAGVVDAAGAMGATHTGAAAEK